MEILLTENETPKIFIPKKNVQKAIDTMVDYYGVILTEEDVLKIMERSEKALSRVLSNGEHGFDTCDRESLISEVSRYVTDDSWRNWPMYGDDSIRKKNFYEAFLEGIKNKPVKVEWTLEEMLED